MRRIVGDDVWESLPAATKELRRAEGPILDAELRSARNLRPPALDSIEKPVIVAAGAGVAAHRRRAVDSLVAAIPRAEMRLLPGAPHNAHSGRPEEFAGLIAELDVLTVGEP